MSGEIDAELNGTLKIQSDDILQVRIPDKLLGRRRRLAGQPIDTTPE